MILVAILIIIVVLSTGAYAYWASLPSVGGLKVTLTSTPLELSLSLDKTRYTFGEEMMLSFYLRNISNETVTVTKNTMQGAEIGKSLTAAEGVTTRPTYMVNVLNHFGLALYYGNGTMIFRYVRRGVSGDYDIILQPKASLNQTYLVDLSTGSDDQGKIIQRTPGTYAISGILYGRLSNESLITLETPTITYILG